MSYSRFIGRIAGRRQPSIIRELLKIQSSASTSTDMIPLSGGHPNREMFPITTMSFTLAGGAKIELSGKAMDEALQYLPTNGHSELLTRLRDLQCQLHGLSEDDFDSGKLDIVTTSGSQSGLSKALELLFDEGDHVCLADYTYFAAKSILDPHGAKYVQVAVDGEGMRPDSLWRELAKRWSPGDPGSPRFIYTNPTGSNPCGTVLPASRKREIYDICSTYDMIILEDDPYYFMQFDYEGSQREPSFLSMDRDCRVLRFDSFSKVVSAGLRLGFVTGPKPLVDRLVLHLQVSELHASSLSQVIINELLKSWNGIEGFQKHAAAIEDFYRRRRDLMLEAAERHLSGLCEWDVPKAGMFLWIRVNGVEDTWRMVMERGLQRNVMVVPGRVFTPDGRGSPFIRASYSSAPVEKFDEAFRRLAQLIRDEVSSQEVSSNQSRA